MIIGRYFNTIFSIGLLWACLAGIVHAREPLLVFGGGYFHAGSHSGGVMQIEYRFKPWRIYNMRPQAICLIPKFASAFLGLGMGVELFVTAHVLIVPSFTPGFYFKGKGRDLGCLLEFRSSVEVAYQWANCMRAGIQAYHLSNAHLSNRNPGANALVLFLAVPLPLEKQDLF